MSASQPSLIAPFRISRPTCRAGSRHNHSNQVFNRETARAGLSPHNRQPKLQRRDSAPGIHAIAFIGQLHIRRTRRMVRNDEIDRAVAESVPELFAVFTFTNRRATLEFSRSIRNFFRGKVKIMRAGLGRDRQPEALRLAQHWQSVRRRMMHDVHATAGFAAQANHRRDRFVFRFSRPRTQKGFIRSGRQLRMLSGSMLQPGPALQREQSAARRAAPTQAWLPADLSR